VFGRCIESGCIPPTRTDGHARCKLCPRVFQRRGWGGAARYHHGADARAGHADLPRDEKVFVRHDDKDRGRVRGRLDQLSEV